MQIPFFRRFEQDFRPIPRPPTNIRPLRPALRAMAVTALVWTSINPQDIAASDSWLTWGGPNGDFRLQSSGLADVWPEAGPERLWSRPIGDGYSGIAAESGRLYTAHRRGEDDVVVALDAETGEMIWESVYAAPFTNAYAEAVGPGPYAMPQVVGERIVMAGGNGRILSLDKSDGSIAWSHDLYHEFGGTVLPFGYSSHALPHGENLIVLAGSRVEKDDPLWADRSAVVALRQSDGAVAWKNLEFENAHSSPVLIDVDGQPQVVALLAREVIGFSPEDGELFWRHPHRTEHGLAASQPVWCPGNILIVSSAYGGGTRALELKKSDGRTTVEELWHTSRAQSHHGSMIVMGDHVYFSSGMNSPTFMVAVEIRTGEVKWQERGLAKSQILRADGKLILLDEDGVLALGRATPERFEVISQIPVLKTYAWTPPTLVRTRLYVRDRESIMAFELGEPDFRI